jgi:predicted  nucleic acid-binding Zn-ribbon protein
MKASPSDQRLLLEIQAIDTHDRQLAYASDHLPETELITSLAAELATSSADFIARQGIVEDARTEIDRIESDISVVQQRLALDVERASHSSNAKDVQALEAEIASLKTRRENLEEMELEVMQRLEDAEKSLAELHSARASVEAELAANEDAREKRRSEISAERAQLAVAREQLVTRIPIDLLALYEKQRNRYGIGAALLTRGISGGSGVTLSETDLSKIRAAAEDDVIMCPDSSCILVRTEESGL